MMATVEGNCITGKQPSHDIGDRFIAKPIEKREHRIEKDEDRRRRSEEDRPVDRHRAMIEIGPKAVG